LKQDIEATHKGCVGDRMEKYPIPLLFLIIFRDVREIRLMIWGSKDQFYDL
jgi:hypothetical protein